MKMRGVIGFCRNFLDADRKLIKQSGCRLRDYLAIKSSNLFDAAWYLEQYADVAEAEVDPILHYLTNGWRDNRDPSQEFSDYLYKCCNDDLDLSQQNPLLHYLHRGKSEGRRINFKKIIAKRFPNEANKGVIYTCITGNYDDLLEHYYVDYNWDYRCYTDNEKLLSLGKVGHWMILPIEYSKLDPIRNARWHKTHPHLLLPQYDYSVWIDGNINIASSYFFNQLNKCIAEKRVLSVPPHPKRDCVYDEAIAIKLTQKENPVIVDQQMVFLREQQFPEKLSLHETNIVFRHHAEPQSIEIMDTWFGMIEQFSRRDQLSFDFALWKSAYPMVDFCGRMDVRNNVKHFIFQSGVNHTGTYLQEAFRCLGVSLIIPIGDDETLLRRCLQGIEQSEFSSRLELILLSDASSPASARDAAREFVKLNAYSQLVEYADALELSALANRALSLGTQDVLILLEPGTQIPRCFEEKVLDCFNSDSSIAISSPLTPRSDLLDLPMLQGLDVEEMQELVKQKVEPRYPSIFFPDCFCFCIRKSFYDAHGGFEQAYTRAREATQDLVMRAFYYEWRIVLNDSLCVSRADVVMIAPDEDNASILANQELFLSRWKASHQFYDKQIQTAAQLDSLRRVLEEL